MKKNKKSLLKRILKWSLITLLVLIIGLFSIPYFFKDKIVQLITKTVNKNINATVTFNETDLSLFRDFPKVNLSLNDIAVVNKAPFLGDTLFSAKELSFSMKLTELFKNSDETIALKKITTKNGQINIKFNNDNVGNYDIALKNEVIKTTENSESFSFAIEEYNLENMNFMFLDENSQIKLQLNNINHSGKGNFTEDILDLNTNSKAVVFFDLEGVNYIHDVTLSLDAILGIDLKNNKYTFKKNTGYINQLPLNFDGFIQLIDDNQVYDLKFKTPTSSFKNALALMPKQYSGNLESINTSGNFDLDGSVKGTLSTNTIPAFNISFSSKNAMFKYSEMPKAVQNINIDAKIINKTGFSKDTYLNLNQLNFKIDEDVFATNGSIANLTTNPKVSLTAKGKINLANIGKVYPVSLEKELAGFLNADVTTNFDMNSIEKGVYQNLKNKGNIQLSGFKYEDATVANAFYINKTVVTFNTNTIVLKEFDAKTGSSDINVNGNLDNFYGFLFNNEVLKGNFNLKSNNFKVSDFLSTEETTEQGTTTKNGQLKIPAFLDCKFTANAKNVIYDNINLNNVSGVVVVKNETVNLQSLKSDVFGGKIGFDGNVSTKGKNSTFAMDLKLDQLNIADSFSSLDMLKSIAPIAKTIEGKINSTIKVSGDLNNDMTPNLQSISGDLFGKLLNPKLNSTNSKTLSLLGDKVSFIDTDKLNLDGINALLSFEDGKVNIKPIPVSYNDIKMIVGGNHSFDNIMNYDIIFDVPVKYLGSEVTNLLAKLSPKDAADVKTVPVKANLTGSFGSPNFSTDLKDATSNLVKNLVERQKQSLINKGKNKLTDLLGINKKLNDSTNTKNDTKDKIKGVLGNLFGKKKKDTTNNKK